jgi:hypothetical protein
MMTACRTAIACPRTAGLVLGLLGSLAGCTPPPAPPPSGSAAAGAASSGERALPQGAIAVGPDLYQVPIGTDAAGCQMYRLHAPGRMATQAIAWRRPDGSFTLDRREAACAP